MAKKNIKKLLNKYKENDIVNIEDIGIVSEIRDIDCELCKNFSKTEYCNVYDCYPLKHVIPVEDYCNEFILDEIKVAEQGKPSMLVIKVPSWEDNFESDSHNLYDLIHKNQDNANIPSSEKNKDLEDDTKTDDTLREKYGDLNDFDIVYALNRKKIDE